MPFKSITVIGRGGRTIAIQERKGNAMVKLESTLVHDANMAECNALAHIMAAIKEYKDACVAWSALACVGNPTLVSLAMANTQVCDTHIKELESVI